MSLLFKPKSQEIDAYFVSIHENSEVEKTLEFSFNCSHDNLNAMERMAELLYKKFEKA